METVQPIALSNVRIVIEMDDWHEYTDSGQEKPAREFESVSFRPVDVRLFNRVTDRLYRFLDRIGDGNMYGEQGPSATHSREVVALCEQLLEIDASFVDAYANLAAAQFWLGDYPEIISRCQPVLDGLFALLPIGFKGRIPYWKLENRPLHLLGHNLVLAYYGLGTSGGDKRAARLARRMLKLWPNDNMGFRYLFTSPYASSSSS